MGHPPQQTDRWQDPFKGLYAERVYELLTTPGNGLPTWPEEDVQVGYTASKGAGAVRRARAFLRMIGQHGAFRPGWKGLDYGAGWGRMASLALSYGSPEQLDLVDAWERPLEILGECGYSNRRWKVSEILKLGEIPEGAYDFAYAFSVFTHLAPRAFWPNLEGLARSVQPGGSVYFTVRHAEFVAHISHHRYPGRLQEMEDALDRAGFWFAPTQRDKGEGRVFGDMILSPEYLAKHAPGSLEYLGAPPGQMQHVYALTP